MQIHEASADYGTVVPKTATALISHADGRLEVITPGNGTIQLPIHQAVLCLVAMKLTDPDWIEDLIDDLEDEGLGE